jgi:hypothetical protein
MPQWQYYLSGHTPELADTGSCGLIRRPEGGPVSLAEFVTRDGDWLIDDTLWKNKYEGEDEPLTEISVERAEQLMGLWVAIGRLDALPSDESSIAPEDAARLIEAERRAAEIWRNVQPPPGAETLRL